MRFLKLLFENSFWLQIWLQKGVKISRFFDANQPIAQNRPFPAAQEKRRERIKGSYRALFLIELIKKSHIPSLFCPAGIHEPKRFMMFYRRAIHVPDATN